MQAEQTTNKQLTQICISATNRTKYLERNVASGELQPKEDFHVKIQEVRDKIAKEAEKERARLSAVSEIKNFNIFR